METANGQHFYRDTLTLTHSLSTYDYSTLVHSTVYGSERTQTKSSFPVITYILIAFQHVIAANPNKNRAHLNYYSHPTFTRSGGFFLFT
jgi:hypothetical protein